MTDNVRAEQGFSAVYTVAEIDPMSGWVTLGDLEDPTAIPLAMLGNEAQVGSRVLLTVTAGDVTVELLT